MKALNADVKIKDQREECDRRWVDEQAEMGKNAAMETSKMPQFPPYTVLHFITISFHLTLGAATSVPHQDKSKSPSNFTRVQGIPLLAGPATNQLVGSLHPDNLDLVPPPGSLAQCLIISRCHTPIFGSALLAPGEVELEKPRKMFWVLYVVRKGGIAERRGVGQVLGEVLELTDDRPEVKLVLLG